MSCLLETTAYLDSDIDVASTQSKVQHLPGQVFVVHMVLVCHLGKCLQLVKGAGGAEGTLHTPTDLQITLARG